MCELGENRTLTIWIAGGGVAADDAAAVPAAWTVTTDHGPAVVKGADELEGGTRLAVVVPAAAQRLEIRRPGSRDGGGAPGWSLALGDARPHREIDALIAVGRGGKYEEALTRLQALRLRAAPAERGPADAAIARMALALGRLDQAEPAFHTAIAAAIAEGRIADVVKDASSLLWALVHLRQRYAEARALLEKTSPFAAQYPEGRVTVDYYAGLLAADTVDVRTALEKYRAAERGARRLGQTNIEESAADEVARVLTRLGRSDEAVAIQRKLAAPTEPCARATRALNLAEAASENAAHGAPPTRDGDVVALLEAARVASQGCPDPHRRSLADIFAAEYALAIGDDHETGQLVRRIEAAAPERDIQCASRRAVIRGRWLLRQHKPQAALAAFDAGLPEARASGLFDEAFRGDVGAGRALLALGRRAAAVSRLKAAQVSLDAMLKGIPVGDGRGAFLGGHDSAVRTLVEALIDSGGTAEAFRVARWARAAELSHLARLDRLAHLSADTRRGWDEALGRYRRIRADIERQAESDWTLPRNELAARRAERQARAEVARLALDDAYRLLEGTGAGEFGVFPPPAAGEFQLALFPAPVGWFAFGATTAGVVVRRIDETAFSSTARAASVVALFGTQLAAAREVRLLPYGAADAVDWQAVTWNGKPLLASVAIVYGLDIGERSGASTSTAATATATERSHQALVIADPNDDLPAARPEADVVTKALTGWTISRLDGRAATRQATLAALQTARLFHYAGHSEAAGGQGMSSALLLTGNARIDLGDLLAAPAVPEWVVLSSCEGAGTSAHEPSLMGIAQVFIAAGARAAIAPTRIVRDAEARAFMSAFYSALAAADTGALAKIGQTRYVRAAYQTAALELFSRGDPGHHASGDGAWQSFRLLVP